MFDTLRKWEQNRHEYAKEWKERTGGKVLGYFQVYFDHSEEGLRMTEATGDQTLLGRGNEQGAGALRATARQRCGSPNVLCGPPLLLHTRLPW
jgi:hypothetical protein